ncbi:MAG TPA: class I SAM-dependent methyltransferase [Methylococcus sp.]|nr:class I SAM-dependent methyltransferase [Methylococcus sp.]
MLYRVFKEVAGALRKSERDFRWALSNPTGRDQGASDEVQATQILLEYAAGLVNERLSPELERRMLEMAARFEAGSGNGTACGLNIFVYHVDMGEAGQLRYRDLTMDTNAFDYRALLRAFVASVRRWEPGALIYLVTDPGHAKDWVPTEDLRVVTLAVDNTRPMWERVNAMCAYVHSKAFAADTLFLDSDAFLNAAFTPYLEGDFDLAVTVREIPGLMPVNEGVLVARSVRPEHVQRFFRRYLATYDRLVADERIREYYGDIQKWRGGQLSLNAITRAAWPYSPYRFTTLDGVSVQALPCDPFNYSHAYGEEWDAEKWKDKIVVHFKGARKASMDRWLRHVGMDAHSIESTSVSPVAPFFALWNKEYGRQPFSSQAVRHAFTAALRTLAAILEANRVGSGAVLADDMLVWFRNAGFLEDPVFIEAMGPLHRDETLRARIWRVYTLCWAARSCLGLDGDYLDIGCYDGKTVAVITRYCQFNKYQEKTYWLYDMFENPPEESRKVHHGPGLFEHVSQMFEPLGNVRVIKGTVPESFQLGLPKRIAFAQIDLNAAEPELACLGAIYDRLLPGGMIVFDDFGFRRYRESRDQISRFLVSRGQIIWESPTGQGLFIKR